MLVSPLSLGLIIPAMRFNWCTQGSTSLPVGQPIISKLCNRPAAENNLFFSFDSKAQTPAMSQPNDTDCNHCLKGELLPETLIPRRNLSMLFFLCHVHSLPNMQVSWPSTHHPLTGIFADHWIKAANAVHASSRPHSLMKD